jgi:ribulose-phosphate 3-epimerase
MPVICPTITAETPQEFSAQLARVQPFAPRIHIDMADGKFAPRKLLDPAQIYVPKDIPTDIHIMYDEPESQLMTLISLRPQMVILHAEAKGDIAAMMAELQKVGIKVGIALLPDTKTKEAALLIPQADQVLIFAGNLGYQGGTADMTQLYKVDEIKSLNAKSEIAWDGGISAQNAKALAGGGIDVLNVGGFIQNAANASEAYQQIVAAIEG